MFGLTLSALEYPVMKSCFTASSRACPALDASIAPGTAAGTKESGCPPFRSGRISLIFWVGNTSFPLWKKKIKVVFLFANNT